MATLAEMVSLVQGIIQDGSFTTTTIKSYINRGLKKIAGGTALPDNPNVLTLPLPELFTIGTVSTVADTAYLSMPAGYQRDLVFCANSLGTQVRLLNSFLQFASRYPLLDNTGSYVEIAAQKGNRLYYQPIPTTVEALTVHYYAAPTTLALDTDTPSCLPDHLHEDLLVNYALMELNKLVEDGQDGGAPNTMRFTSLFYSAVKELENWNPIDAEPVYFAYGQDSRDYPIE